VQPSSLWDRAERVFQQPLWEDWREFDSRTKREVLT